MSEKLICLLLNFLSYTIIRVAGYNELPSADSSTVRLQKVNRSFVLVTHAVVELLQH